MEEQKAAAGVRVGHIGKLLGGDVQPFRHQLAVARGEVQQIDKIAVFQNVFDLRRGKQVLRVLRCPGRDAAPLSETLPDLGAVCRRLFLLQEQVKFVHEIPGGPPNGAVHRDGVPYRVLDNEHPRLFQILAEALDIKADKAVADIHGGTVVEEVERAVHIQVKRLGHTVRLRDMLGGEGGHEVGEDRHILRPGICEVRLIDLLHGPVNDVFLNGLQTCLAAHDKLTEGQHEITFQRQRVLFLAVIEVDIQRIYIVAAVGREPDHLAAQPVHQRGIFVLRVTDDDVILCGQHDIGDLPFTAHGFAAARCAEYKAVGTAGLLAVQQDHVVGESVEAVIHGAPAHEKLLGDEGDKYRQRRCGEAPFDLDTVEAQRQRGHKPVLLLEVQPGQNAVVRLGDAGRLRNGDLQLLFRGRQMQHEEGHIEHSLVAALQILQEIFRRAAVGGEVGGENIQIVAAACSLLLLLNLHGVQIGDLALDHLDCLVLVDAADVHGDEKVPLHIHEIREDAVLNFRGQYLQEGHRTVHFSYAETPRLAKLEGRRRDKVLDGQTACREPVPFKGELSALRMEKTMQQRQPLFAVQHPCARAHDLEAVQGVCLDPGKPCPRRRKIFRLDGQRDIFALYKAVVAALILHLQDTGRLHAHIIQRVALGVHAEQVSVLVLMAAAMVSAASL